ncbi:MAG TPA: hypothetical protein VEO54_16495 [Thermoanaerobaculia bacterium]|nr:hypothetical protein [Thermoanaerobaculia bacterium]
MIIAAAALTLGISLEIDLTALIRRQERRAPEVTCGIKVVGYHFAGTPGQQVRYAGETFTIPKEGFLEVISLPKVTTYIVDGRTLPLEDGVSPLDGFSFRWITLPASPVKGEMK